MKDTVWGWVAVAALTLALGACSNDEDDTVIRPAAGFERAFNAVPDSPVLNFLGDNQLQRSQFTASLGFATGTGFVQKGVGDILVDVSYFDESRELVVAVDDFPFDLDLDDEASVIALGTMSAVRVVVVENRPSAIPPETAELQFVHAVAGAGAVDIFVTSADGTPDVTLSFGQVSALATFPASATARIRVRGAGSPDVLYDTGDFALLQGERRLILLRNYFGPGGNGLTLDSANTIGVTPFANQVLPSGVRIINQVADAASVDVFVGAVDGTPDFDAVPFAGVSEFVEFEAGVFPLTVTVDDAPAEVVYQNDSIFLPAGQFRTLVISGAAADDSTEAAAHLDDDRPIATHAATLKVLHNAPALGLLDFYLVEPGQSHLTIDPDFVELGYRTSIQLVYGAGNYEAVFTDAGAKTIAFGPEPVTLGDGVFLISLADAEGGGEPVQLVLGDDFIP